jgi:hypothetical protein
MSQPAAFDFANQYYTRWSDSWLGIALDSFDASFEIDVELSAEASDHLFISLLKKTVSVDGVIVELDFQLYLAADASESMSFTTGLNLTVSGCSQLEYYASVTDAMKQLTEPVAIMMPALDPTVDLTKTQAINL